MIVINASTMVIIRFIQIPIYLTANVSISSITAVLLDGLYAFLGWRKARCPWKQKKDRLFPKRSPCAGRGTIIEPILTIIGPCIYLVYRQIAK